LVLVNRDHPADGEPRDLVAASPMVPVMLDGISLRPTALDAVAGLFAAARAEGVGPFTVSSGFRSAASQQQLWDEGPQRFGDQWRDYVLPPGHSEHQTGLAADIMATGIPKADLGASPEGRWLAANAPRFGLILRYPEGKQPITGVAAEPWHFRFVGQAHATAMTGQGLVLEEYLTQACPSGGSA
jgi:D-alanyl-D-alanine carboxypeptidase